MLENIKNIIAVPELRKRILFTLGLLGVYRIGGHIPTPGVDPQALAELARQLSETMFGLYDMFSGGNLSQMTIFALGIMPYISASIILQLLTVVSPYLERLSKEGELGRRKITQYTRYGTLLISVVQALGIAVFLERQTNLEQLQTGNMSLLRLVILVVMMVIVVGVIVFVERGHRRVTVQYAKRVVGRRMYGGTSTHIPLKVNTGGVMPVIFASSILAFPATMAPVVTQEGWLQSLLTQLGYG